MCFLQSLGHCFETITLKSSSEFCNFLMLKALNYFFKGVRNVSLPVINLLQFYFKAFFIWFRVQGTPQTPELFWAKKNYIDVIAAETQVFLWKVFNSSRLVGYPGSRVALFMKEGNSGGGDVNMQFASASRDNFLDLGMRYRTKMEYFPALCLRNSIM